MDALSVASLSGRGIVDLSDALRAVPYTTLKLNVSDNQLLKLDGLNADKRAHSLIELNAERNRLVFLAAPASAAAAASASAGGGMSPLYGLANLRVLKLHDNSISVLDGLSSLKALEYLDVSKNHLTAITGLAHNTNLTHLDLSINSIASFGDLSPNIKLKTLLLDRNLITSLQSAVHDLPLSGSMTTLSLSHNHLSSLSELTFLTKLDTLTVVNVDGNPFTLVTASARIDIRPFVLFLLPRVTVLNGSAVKKLEWRQSQKLFIDPHTNTYDTQLMEWLRPEESDRLYSYLAQASPLPASQHPQQPTNNGDSKHTTVAIPNHTAPVSAAAPTARQAMNTTAPAGATSADGAETDRLRAENERQKASMRREIEANRKKREQTAAARQSQQPPSRGNTPVRNGAVSRIQPQHPSPAAAQQSSTANTPQFNATGQALAPSSFTALPTPALFQTASGAPVGPAYWPIAGGAGSVPNAGAPAAVVVPSAADLLAMDDGYMKLQRTVKDMKRYLREFATREREKELAKLKDAHALTEWLAAARVPQAKQQNAASSIQAMWRGHKTRKRVEPARKLFSAQKTVTALQSELTSVRSALAKEVERRELQDSAIRVLWDELRRMRAFCETKIGLPPPPQSAGSSAADSDPLGNVASPLPVTTNATAPNAASSKSRGASAAAQPSGPAPSDRSRQSHAPAPAAASAIRTAISTPAEDDESYRARRAAEWAAADAARFERADADREAREAERRQRWAREEAEHAERMAKWKAAEAAAAATAAAAAAQPQPQTQRQPSASRQSERSAAPSAAAAAIPASKNRRRHDSDEPLTTGATDEDEDEDDRRQTRRQPRAGRGNDSSDETAPVRSSRPAPAPAAQPSAAPPAAAAPAVDQKTEAGGMDTNVFAGLDFSKLIVDVIQASDLSVLPSGGDRKAVSLPNPYAVLFFQGSSGETEPVERSKDPFWNTNFCFDVENHPERTDADPDAASDGADDNNIVISIVSKPAATTAASEEGEFLGEIVLPIRNFRDQLKHIAWYPLTGSLRTGPNGQTSQPVTGSVQLSLLWLYDIPQLLTSLQQRRAASAESGVGAAAGGGGGATDVDALLEQIAFSKLIVDIVEARNLPAPKAASGSRRPYVQLSFQGATARTDEAKSPAAADGSLAPASSSDAFWNINFTFDVDRDEPLTLLVSVVTDDASATANAAAAIIGEVSIPLSDLRDQRKHSDWYTLKPRNGHQQQQSSRGQIRLNLLWLHSLAAFMPPPATTAPAKRRN